MNKIGSQEQGQSRSEAARDTARVSWRNRLTLKEKARLEALDRDHPIINDSAGPPSRSMCMWQGEGESPFCGG